VGSDAEGGIDGSGVVHDAVFVFESGIIMDDDTAVTSGKADRQLAASLADDGRRGCRSAKFSTPKPG
jgi:hypothetical protein